MMEVKVPELAESVTEGTVAAWLKNPGDYVEKGEQLVELETDKVNVEIAAEEGGILQEILAEPGDTVKVGDVIAQLNTSASAEKGVPASEPNKPAAEQKTLSAADQSVPAAAEADLKKSRLLRPVATPAARRHAREKGIDLNEVAARDPLGRLRKSDVMEHLAVKAEAGRLNKTEQPVFEADAGKPVERIRMSRRRQTIAQRLVEAQQTAAMLTTFNEVDMTNLLDLRNRRKDQFLEANGVKLGFMSFFTKAVIGALKKYPYVNAEINGDDILLKKFYDIGIAVSTEDGLVVPVVSDADRLDFAGIEKEIARLAAKAHEKKLALSDLQGGTFTITNGGVFGSLWSTPILNAPQVGILGMHKVQMRPVAIDDERFENRPMMYLALSYDHRIIDGKDAVGFLVKVKELIEDPEALLLEG
ncbi:2-oxoglutarate dehydrogenase E2 component (dihydrolipoamide succinyltransferase) [Evansella caseinilytica]|uniref:Dihydrolipoyllysine-residue succinyltransferase component of 2-oxoglutarate dehydrogenase complex n=1 Tax=Evansella caseinilytica TaxID=1503961 RepID=A0A1H3NNM9_9BACI|nr:2-oxoglutarate dehydrogenase complex dihydrolipoyllysine-residue succinyltransferase [Evansella caseinilytica]SDY90526.1 2-oxoglutarate dehydrogenase E2 component (dihydrolipoamide succinyltransferase) [Evansella caseinilytica]